MIKQIKARPFDFTFDPKTTALIVIDMQRDFVQKGGFGEVLGNDVSPLQKAIAPILKVLECCRAQHMLIIHTREGHRPDLTDCPPAKLLEKSHRLSYPRSQDTDVRQFGYILQRFPHLRPKFRQPVLPKYLLQ